MQAPSQRHSKDAMASLLESWLDITQSAKMHRQLALSGCRSQLGWTVTKRLIAAFGEWRKVSGFQAAQRLASLRRAAFIILPARRKRRLAETFSVCALTHHLGCEKWTF
eukprot:2560058-Rhodomonas_salina.1